MKEFVIEHFEDFVNRRKAEVIQHNMTADFLDHDGPGGKPAGIAGNEAMMRAMYKQMPDLRVEVLDSLADGDKVACRNIWRWTDPASGKKLQFHGFVLWRFEDGRIAERWATVSPPPRAGPGPYRKLHLTPRSRASYAACTLETAGRPCGRKRLSPLRCLDSEASHHRIGPAVRRGEG